MVHGQSGDGATPVRDSRSQTTRSPPTMNPLPKVQPMAMQTRSIVGREPELEAIRNFIERIRHRPAAFILAGQAGIGKTTLWQAGVDAAATHGVRVLTSRAGESETRLLYSTWTPLWGGVAPASSEPLPPPQRTALEVALLRVDASGPPPDQRAVAVAALAMFRILSADEPVLLAIDDVQWVDTSSARVLSFVARRIAEESVGLLATVRLGIQRRDPIIERAMATSATVESVHVGPLSPETLHSLIRASMGDELTYPVVRRIHDASGGNPFFALEIAKELARRGVPRAGEVLPIPEDVVTLLRQRVDALPRTARRALLVVASTARPTEGLVRSTGLGDRAATALTRAEEAGVITMSEARISFTHPLFASAIYTSAPAAERRDVHRRVADEVDDMEERARHLALASPVHDEAVAHALDDAARGARSRGAPASAAELSELAWQMTWPSDGRAAIDRMVDAAGHHYDAGDAGRAWALLEDAIHSSPPGVERARILFRLAAISWMDMNRVEDLCQRALQETDRDADLLSAIREHLAWVGIYRGDLATASRHASESLARARKGRDGSVLAASVSTFGMVEFLLGRPAQTMMTEGERLQDAASRAGGIEDLTYTTPQTNHGLQLMWGGELEAARETLQAELKTYEDRGRYLFRDEILAYLAEVECRSGNLDKAVHHAREAFEIDVESGRHTGTGHILFPKARSALGRVGGRTAAGELTPTERRIAELVAEGKTNREVADAMFLSVKTVEANLSRVFHKLGVRSRTELSREFIIGRGRPG